MTVCDKAILLDILDTAGQEEFCTMRDAYIRSGKGFIIVFSVLDNDSFSSVGEYYDNVLRAKAVDSYPVVICGNKCDIPEGTSRVVGEQEALELASTFDNAPYFDTSAMSRTNIDEAFMKLAEIMLSRYGAEKSDFDEGHPDRKKKGKCMVF